MIDAVESYRDMLTSLQDLYLSSVSNKLNEVMKVLTVIATLFIPVSFFAGVFGMNFDYMPELRWKWSYPIFWLVIVCALRGYAHVVPAQAVVVGRERDGANPAARATMAG